MGLENLPIRWRLTLLNAVMIGVILLTLAGSFVWLWYEQRVDQVDNTTRIQAMEAATALKEGEDLLGEDKNELTQATAGGTVVIVIRDAQGKVLGQRPKPSEKIDFSTKEVHDPVWKEAFNKEEPEHDKVERSAEGADYRVYALPVEPRVGTGRNRLSPATLTASARMVEAGKPYPSFSSVLDQLAPVMSTVGLLGFVLLVGGAYLLTRAALSPVEAVVRAAGEMSEGDLSRRLPVANPKDEIGRLTTTINALLARLEVAFTRLEVTLSHLEETLSRQRRFAADASHELRTPLTSISGHARMLDEWALD